jgi:RNA polymerase sigma-70 factor (ECF subfamily)
VDDAAELERTYRREATRIRAALAARIGDVGLAEEAVQDAFVEALEHWRAEGIPPSPGGWLATTAWRKAVDRLRRDRTGQDKLAQLAAAQAQAAQAQAAQAPAAQDGGPGTGGPGRRPRYRRLRTPAQGWLATGAPGMTRMSCSA